MFSLWFKTNVMVFKLFNLVYDTIFLKKEIAWENVLKLKTTTANHGRPSVYRVH